jgi:hypothetical protein
MSNNPSWLRLRWPLLLALLVSVLFHAWMIGGVDGWLPGEDAPEQSLIHVVLTPLPTPEVKPVRPEPARPRPAKPRPAKPAPVQTPSVPKPAAMPVTPVNNAAAPEETALPATPAPAPVEEPAVTQAAEEPVPAVPHHVEIDYQVLRKGGVAAVERHRYQAADDGSYTLTSVAEPKGLLSLALSDLTQRSEGMVTAHGLRPSSFLYQYGKNIDKAQTATFDWSGRKLLMETAGRKQEAELQEGAQDMMSFMYQFMFVPPLQEMQLAVTTGKKLKVYNYAFEGEETLTTKAGVLRTLRIGKSGGDGEEKTEIWLAADHFYLPVKISKTEKDGTVTERIATRLQTE